MASALEIPLSAAVQRDSAQVNVWGNRFPIFAILGVSGGFFLAVFLLQSLQAPYPQHGDCWTEMDCITAARNFADHGFTASHFNPGRDRGQEIGLEPVYVSEGRHPTGSYVVLGLLYRAGLSFATARAVPLAMSALGVLVFFYLMRRVLGEWQTPLIASIALATEPAFYLLSDSIYYFGYCFLLKPLFWLCICQATVTEAHRRRYLVLAVVVAFTQAAVFSYEPLPAMGLFCVLFPLLFGKGTVRQNGYLGFRFGLFFSLGCVIAMASRFAHMALLHGGVVEAIHNFQMALLVRSVGVAGVEQPVPSWPYYLTEIAARIWFMNPVHLAVIAIGLGTLGLLQAQPRPAVKLALLLAGIEGFYFLLMRQHAFQHLHTLDNLVFSVALFTAIAIQLLSSRELGGLRLASPQILVAAVAVVAILLGPTRAGPNLERHHDWSGWIASSRALAARMPDNAVVFLHTGDDPKFGFFLERTFLLRQGWDYNHLRPRPLWGAKELLALDTRGRPLYVLISTQDPCFGELARTFRRVGGYEQDGMRVELYEVRSPGASTES